MPTSKSNPTAGEITQDDVPSTTDPKETNFPDPVEADEEAPQPVEIEDDAIERVAGEVWATYTGFRPSKRILTVDDLKTLGDKGAKEPLEWSAENRYSVEVSDVHPMVLRYMEEQDDDFKVERF